MAVNHLAVFLGHLPTPPVVLIGGVVDPNHVLDALPTQQRARVEIIEQGAQEPNIVGRRDDPAAVGVHVLDVPAVGILATGAVVADLARDPLVDRGVTAARPADPDGLEDVLGDPLAVVAAGDLLDDHPEQAVAVVGVDVAAPGSNCMG